MYTISANRLAGDSVTYDGTGSYTPNKFITPLYLVFHYTVLDYSSTIRSFGPNGPQSASAHLVVSRNGEVTQMVDFNRRAWHAGTSSWEGLQDMNTYSIGIEVENYGYLHQKPDGSFVSDNNNPVPSDQVIQARHKNPACTANFWQQYPPEQLDVCEQLATALTSTYKLKGIAGHDDIAPSRKFDPGPAFPMERMRTAASGLDEHIETGRQYVVNVPKLNIRSGPGTNFPAGLPLTQDTKVSQLQMGADGWMEVAVLAPGDIRGWVYGAYLA